MGRIIVGQSGVGKSYFAYKRVGYVDLDITLFDWNVKTYIKVANFLAGAYHVLLSLDKEVLRELRRKKIPYILVMPHPHLKEEYISRFKTRGNSVGHIERISQEWDSMLKWAEKHEKNVYYVNYLTDIEDILNE